MGTAGAAAVIVGIGGVAILTFALTRPRASSAPPTAAVAAFNAGLVSDLLTTVGPHLRAGDVVDLVSGNSGGVVDPANIAEWAAEVAQALPQVRITAHTSQLANVQALLAAPLPANVYGVAYDYEPNYEPEFTWDFPTTLATFRTFASYCHAAGKKAIGYPTGRPLLESDLLSYGWDYGKLASVVDELWAQTETWCSQGVNAAAMAKLQQQFAGVGQPLSKLRNNATIGSSALGVTPQAAAACLSQAPKGAGWFLWPTEGEMNEVAQTLQLLGR